MLQFSEDHAPAIEIFFEICEMTNEEYQQAIEWLFVQAPNYQLEGKKAYKPGLDNIVKLCEFFGNPQDKIKTVHIGGTNGKGSTSNLLASVMQEAGYRTGLYNSPHLIDFTERIKINGENCSKEFVYGFIQKLKTLPTDIRPSFFEFTTVMAFEYFYQNNVDLAIIEVGLGGRLDSTNIIQPLVSAVTNVALDHQNILGDTLEEIAAEKAGIIKSKTPIICGDDDLTVHSIMRARALEKNAPFIDSTAIETTLTSDLTGNYQKKNIKVAVALVEELRKVGYSIAPQHIASGMLNVYRNTGFIGRWFKFSEDPLTICDTAHNQAGLTEVFEQLNSMDCRKHIVLGFVNDKKIDEVLKILPPNSSYYFVKPNIERGRNPAEYRNLLENAKINYKIYQNLQDGYVAALQNVSDGEMIFIGGSNFIVGEFLEKNLEK